MYLNINEVATMHFFARFYVLGRKKTTLVLYVRTVTEYTSLCDLTFRVLECAGVMAIDCVSCEIPELIFYVLRTETKVIKHV